MDLFSYLIDYVIGHIWVPLALLFVFGLIILGFRWAIRYGIRAVLIMIVAAILTGCFMSIFFTGIMLTSKLAVTLPEFLCEQLEFCPPEAKESTKIDTGEKGGGKSATGDAITGADGPLLGHYIVDSPSDDHCATVRESPEPTSKELGCVPNKVEVEVIDRKLGEEEFNGTKWRVKIDHVTLSDGRFFEGWIHFGTLGDRIGS